MSSSRSDTDMTSLWFPLRDRKVPRKSWRIAPKTWGCEKTSKWDAESHFPLKQNKSKNYLAIKTICSYNKTKFHKVGDILCHKTMNVAVNITSEKYRKANLANWQSMGHERGGKMSDLPMELSKPYWRRESLFGRIWPKKIRLALGMEKIINLHLLEDNTQSAMSWGQKGRAMNKLKKRASARKTAIDTSDVHFDKRR